MLQISLLVWQALGKLAQFFKFMIRWEKLLHSSAPVCFASFWFMPTTTQHVYSVTKWDTLVVFFSFSQDKVVSFKGFSSVNSETFEFKQIQDSEKYLLVTPYCFPVLLHCWLTVSSGGKRFWRRILCELSHFHVVPNRKSKYNETNKFWLQNQRTFVTFLIFCILKIRL